MNLDDLLWERDKRIIQKGGFKSFCEYYAPRLCVGYDFEMAPHHLLMAEELTNAIEYPEYKVMFLEPPGHAKSTYSSILFPAYFMYKCIGYPILAASHTSGLAEHFGRETKRIVEDEFFSYLANANLTKDSKASLRFSLTSGSRYQGAGVGKAIAGIRARLGIIDDPVKGSEAADSEVMSDKVWKWYLYDFITRLLPGASQVLVVTTWNEYDLPQMILNSPHGKNWKVIKLPAIAEDNDYMGRKKGEPLWPQLWPLEKLLEIKEGYKNEPRVWESLYQQNPTIEQGDYFKREWIQKINKIPEGLRYYGASDYAVTDGRGDYTVHITIGYDDVHDNIYIVNIWREQTTTEIWVEEFLRISKEYNVIMWAEESGQIIKSLDPFIKKEMANRNQFVFREQFTSATNKTIRAQSFRAYMAQKKVFILNDYWTPALEREMIAFPAGKNDDQVDALGLIGRMLDDMLMRVEKVKKKEEYEYRDNMIMLPSLEDKISGNKPPAYKKF